MAHVAEHKKDKVAKLVKYFNEYDIIGVANMENLPAAQLQKIRSNLRGTVELYMTKRRLINIAIDQVKDKRPELAKLKEELKGMPALAFTKENPFKLFKTLKKSKSPAPAKEGQVAPSDVVVPAGPTPFAPGPVISELAQLGIKSKVDAGKIAIVNDTTVIKEGEPFSAKLASMLTRLNILPMEIGLNISSILEGDVVYGKKVLDIDEEQFMGDLCRAASEALNLTVETAYATSENIELLLQKSSRQARALADESAFLTAENVEELLAKGQREGSSLAGEAKFEAQ